jgi:O6-methylguanine-DNA--protein-cysteine methyltransferase
MGSGSEKTAREAKGEMVTPLGRFVLTASRLGLRRIRITDGSQKASTGTRPTGSTPKPDPRAQRHLEWAILELREYFAGERRSFHVPLDLQGSPRRLLLWEHLRRIPFGETITCLELARRLGLGEGPGRVKSGCAANPVPVIIPSHRVDMQGGGVKGSERDRRCRGVLQDLETGSSLPATLNERAEPDSIQSEGRARTRFRTSSAGGRYRP